MFVTRLTRKKTRKTTTGQANHATFVDVFSAEKKMVCQAGVDAFMLTRMGIFIHQRHAQTWVGRYLYAPVETL